MKEENSMKNSQNMSVEPLVVLSRKRKLGDDSLDGLSVKKRVLSTEERERDEENRKFVTTEGSRRYVVFPIMYADLNECYEKQLEVFWTVNDVDLGGDAKDKAELMKDTYNQANNAAIIEATKIVLGYFGASDGIVMENVQTRFAEEIPLIEARQFYGIQAGIESVHASMYSHLIEVYADSPQDKDRIFRALETLPVVRAKAEWAKKYLDPDLPLDERIVAQTAIEGIHFASSFAFIYWLKDKFKGKFQGLIKSNEFINRDENLHVEFHFVLWHLLPRKTPIKKIREIYASALEVELAFQRYIIGTGIIGLSLARMEEHVRYIANYWFSLFKTKEDMSSSALVTNSDGSAPQPLDEVRRISRQTKVNFFEQKNAMYVQPDITDQVADLTEDF